MILSKCMKFCSALVLATLVTAVIALLAVPCSTVHAGTVSHWTFDTDYTDATTTHDALVGAGVPSINTDDTQYGAGSLDLDGASWLDAGSWGLGGSFSVATWVKPSNVGANWKGFLGKQETAGEKVFWLGQHITDGKVRFQNYFDGNTDSPVIDTGFAITNNQWYHVAAVWDDTADTQTVYINGQEVRQIARAGKNQATGTSRLQIGSVSGGTGIYTGLMDETWVFDHALSAAEVQNLTWANDPAATPERQIVRMLDFETGDMDGWYAVPAPVGTNVGNNAVFSAGNMPTGLPATGFDNTTTQGNYFVRTYEGEVLDNSDTPTGIAETTPFILGDDARFDFMIGGGRHPFSGDPDTPGTNITSLNLEREVAPGDWEMIRTATGINGNYMNPITWDVGAYAGDTVRLRIYDTATGGWGHIDVDSIKYSATETLPESGLWSVDFQGTPGGTWDQPVPTTMLGVESDYGHGNFWNAFVLDSYPDTHSDPSMALVDSNGNPTSVVFSVDGTVGAYNSTDANILNGDYLFTNAGSGVDAEIDWSLSGLEPYGWYEIYLYGGIGRDVEMLLDTNGDGSLLDETSVLADTTGVLVRFDADANGALIGQMLNLASEANWSGFQVRLVPEPSSLILCGIGIFGLVLFGRSRRKRT